MASRNWAVEAYISSREVSALSFGPPTIIDVRIRATIPDPKKAQDTKKPVATLEGDILKLQVEFGASDQPGMDFKVVDAPFSGMGLLMEIRRLKIDLDPFTMQFPGLDKVGTFATQNMKIFARQEGIS